MPPGGSGADRSPDSTESGEPPGVGMVADDHNDLTRQLSGIVPVQQVCETVVISRDHDHHLRTRIAQGEMILDPEARCRRFEMGFEIGNRNIEALQVLFQS